VEVRDCNISALRPILSTEQRRTTMSRQPTALPLLKQIPSSCERISQSSTSTSWQSQMSIPSRFDGMSPGDCEFATERTDARPWLATEDLVGCEQINVSYRAH
jgi:hypothetical protein